MANYIDLTNKRFGKLIALKRDYNTNGKTGTYWLCQCDCGNIVSCRRDTLTKGSKTSCGCDLAEKNSKAHLKDETGKRYGKLTVLERAGTKNNCATWLCQCDCGNKTIVYGSTLRNGETQSCGCNRKLGNNKINEIGNKYGYLTVLSLSPHKQGTHSIWRCKCKCGNETDVNGAYLRSGAVQSCGCLNMSSGEQAIKNLLDKYKINYKTQYTFQDCRSPSNNLLRFDFAIFDNNNNLFCLIEYNGKQHYTPIDYFGGEAEYQKLINHDTIKKNFCKKNNIKLIIISYEKKINQLTLKDLGVEDINELSQ